MTSESLWSVDILVWLTVVKGILCKPTYIRDVLYKQRVYTELNVSIELHKVDNSIN